MIEVREVDPHDDAALRAWYDALRAGAVAGREAPLVATYDSFTASMRTPGSNKQRLPAVAVEAGDVVGALLLESPLREDLTTAAVEVDVPPEHRRRGVGALLWRWGLSRATASGRHVLQAEVEVPAGVADDDWPGTAAARRWGFVPEHEEDRMVLDLPAPAAPAAHDVVVWQGPCPDRLVASYARLRTLMSTDVPSGGMARSTVHWDVERIRRSEARMAATYRTYTALALRESVAVGYTLAFVPHSAPADVVQDDTFVVAAQRGRGIGAALKGANLAALDARRVHTWVGTDNQAMQRLNTGLGFRRVARSVELQRG